MKTIRIGTFNVNNLFARYSFKKRTKTKKAIKDGWDANKRYFDILNERAKRITAKTIKACRAHVLALQEVENLDTLKRFRSRFLGGRKSFPHSVLIDGNDNRMIDVAVLSKYPLVHVRSYHHLRTENKKAYIFSRDCLEVDVNLPGDNVYTLYVNHFKSIFDMWDPCNGRRKSKTKRQRQSKAVMDIVKSRFGENPGNENFLILADLNDYAETDVQGETGINELVDWDQVVNIVDRLPKKDRWTHYYEGNKKCNFLEAYRQLDYILLSKSLAKANKGKPKIERRGMPKMADRFTGPRFPNVGKRKPKASDHCPVIMTVKVET
jgi:predicted extracellular nuclease